MHFTLTSFSPLITRGESISTDVPHSQIGCDDMTVIDTGGQLVSLLTKALEIETTYEEAGMKQGYFHTETDRMREIIQMMIFDSKLHKTLVESMIQRTNVPGEKIPNASSLGTYMLPAELNAMTMLGIADMEKLAHDLYSHIRSAVEASDTSAYLTPEDRKYVLETLAKLIHAEKVHYDVAMSSAGVF